MDSDRLSDISDRTLELLEKRQAVTEKLDELPYDLVLYIERAIVHAELGYPDLAAGDAYRALLLTDEVRDESFEYHEQALEALRAHQDDDPAVLHRLQRHGSINIADETRYDTDIEEENAPLIHLAKRASIRCYQILSISLLLCGCLKSAYEFCGRGLAAVPEDEELLQSQEYIQKLARRRLNVGDGDGELDINELPDQGLVRREIYPWNTHEPDRCSQETLEFLNKELEQVAPKLVVRATELPTLIDSSSTSEKDDNISTNLQLGLFAKSDIPPGAEVLSEFSVLTANNRLLDPLCDTCSSELPGLESTNNNEVISCPDCEDTPFCSQECYEQSARYHPAVCDKGMDSIAKDPDPKESPNALYLLLLARALAMAATQEVHPLDLKEIAYIWGDFIPSTSNAVPLDVAGTDGPPPIWTLPFSFTANIAGPLHVLEKMDIDIFEGLRLWDLWIMNTLYAKFRGTASARVSTRDGRPEVAAVHPLWCLANHDCDPNVSWEWGGRMKFTAREKRIGDTGAMMGTLGGAELADEHGSRSGGIKAGEEVLSHYCDIELPVRERREWASGSLGGWCMCARCKREAKLEDEKEKLRLNNGDFLALKN
jgi:hypothetical protein